MIDANVLHIEYASIICLRNFTRGTDVAVRMNIAQRRNG